VCRSEVGRIILELTDWYAEAYAPAYQTIVCYTDNIYVMIIQITRLLTNDE